MTHQPPDPQPDLFGETLERVEQRSPYVFEQLEVFNWGPFQGLHRVSFDPRGSAIIGQTGSGKTTLVDAMMTLIAPRPLYNLASTGGHESDRDLISYVRGRSGEGNRDDESHIDRPGATVSGIALGYCDGTHRVTQSAIFWLDGSSSAATDLKKLWIFARQSDRSLADWLALHQEGGARSVKALARELPYTEVRDSKKAFLALSSRFFEVGENAFQLLNRAAGLKQLNSIDELFRELVLEDKSATVQAAEVVDGFDVLREIHAELQIARDQQQSLLPIQQEEQIRRRKDTQRDELENLKRILPIWFAGSGLSLWQARRAELAGELTRIESRQRQLQQQLEQHERAVEDAHRFYIEQGGGNIEQLERQLAQQQFILRACQRNARDYQLLARVLDFDETLSAAALAANQQQGQQQHASIAERQQQLEELRFRQGGELKQLEQEQGRLDEALRLAGTHAHSNIDGTFLRFKADLAQALTIPEDELAYVAELVEVRKEESAWRGAIERAIGSHRLRLILPAERMQSALEWVNRRDNRLHVRLLDAGQYAGPVRFRDQGFTRKLDYRRHPLREAVKALLAELDRDCVDSPEQLRQRPHAMTREGLMSGRAGQFDKQDQKRLDADWMTGFDNRDRLRQLEGQRADAARVLLEKQRAYQTTSDQHRELTQQLQLLAQLQQLEFESIDLPRAEAELQRLNAQLQQLQAPDSDAAQARKLWELAKQQRDALHGELAEQQRLRGRIDEDLRRADTSIAQLRKRLGAGLGAEQQALGDRRFAQETVDQLDQLDEQERVATQQLGQELDAVNAALNTSVNRLIRLMGQAKARDTGALAELGSDIRDIPGYLRQLELLTKEALPEKLERFLAYLNKSSDEGVTQLLSTIDNEVAIIEERIEALNRTLIQVDFQPGRYLKLEPRQVQHETLVSIKRLQKELVSASLQDDQGESHYKALVRLVERLRENVERKHTQGARALLDPRYRLQFFFHVIERDGNRLIEERTGSKGGSGGEKEIIASYILTASLSYALSPETTAHPLFGSVVLDEAFSKSSQAVAARIIEALRQFGLHPLFITPNKEMRLLRAHTRSAILVHRKGPRAVTSSLSWEELDQQARKRARA